MVGHKDGELQGVCVWCHESIVYLHYTSMSEYM